MLPKPKISEVTELREHLQMLYSANAPMSDYFKAKNHQLKDMVLPENCNSAGLSGKRFQCEVCQEKFASRQGLNQHIGKMHSMFEDPVTCPVCNGQFRHKHALRFHIRQVHEKATRVNCHVCGKTCYNKQVALRHFRMKHDIF